MKFLQSRTGCGGHRLADGCWSGAGGNAGKTCWSSPRISTTSSPSIRRRPMSSPRANWSPTPTTGWSSTTRKTRPCWRRALPPNGRRTTPPRPSPSRCATASPSTRAIRFAAEDVKFSLARVIKLNLTPAFILAQLGWTPENVDDMITADGNTVTVSYDGDFSSGFVLNVLAVAPGLDRRRKDRHGPRGRWRHGQCLAQPEHRRFRPVQPDRLSPGRNHPPHRQSELLQGRAEGEAGDHPPRRRSRDPAASAEVR